MFTTSYEHYAVNAFDGGASDYLLKPVDRQRLQKAIARVQLRLSLSTENSPSAQAVPTPTGADPSPEPMRKYLQWICIQNGRHSNLIAVDEVLYFKADHKYTSVFTQDRQTLINKSIKCLADELDSSRFWRIHRSTIINVAWIESVSRSATGRGTIQLKNCPVILTVSRAYLHLFRQM